MAAKNKKTKYEDRRLPLKSRPWTIPNFPGLGGDLQVTSKAVRDKFQYLLDLFRPQRDSGKILHTNFDSEVILSTDNPLAKDLPLTAVGLREVVIENISTKDWDKKYKSQAPAMARKIQSVDKTKTVGDKERFYASLPKPFNINTAKTTSVLSMDAENVVFAKSLTQSEADTYSATIWVTPPPSDTTCTYSPVALVPWLTAHPTNQPQLPWMSPVTGGPCWNAGATFQSSTTQAVSFYIDYYSKNMPATDLHEHRWCGPMGGGLDCSANPLTDPNCLVEDPNNPGCYAQQYRIHFMTIMGSCPGLNGPFTTHPLNISNGGFYYTTWVEVMDACIAGGYYVGNNTDSYEQLNAQAGIIIGYWIHFCDNSCLNPPLPVWNGYSCNSQFCQYCVNATGNCGGNNADGKIGWELFCTMCNTGANPSFDWNVTDDASGTIVSQGILDGVAGTSTVSIGAANGPAVVASFTLMCWQTLLHPPGNYTMHVTNFTGGGNIYPDIDISGVVAGNTPLNCIPGDPNYNATCCTPSWNCVNPCECIDPGDGTGTFQTLFACEQQCICPSWDCVSPGNCVDPGDGSGQYSSQADCDLGCPPDPPSPNEPEPEAIDCNTFIKPCDEY